MASIQYVEITVKDLEKNLEEILKKIGEKGSKMLSQASPVGKGDGGVHGHLKDNWTYEFEKSNKYPTVIIHANDKAYITHFLEFGTSKMSARPFIRTTSKKIEQALIEEMKKIDLEIKTKTKTLK